MDINQIKQKIKEEEYVFLKNHPDLNNNIILLTLGGSYAYGTNIPTSDLDIRGICLNSKKEILIMKCKDKPIVDIPTDTTIYYLKQIIQLLSNANPNVLEVLGTNEEQILQITKEGVMLRNNVSLFLSQRVIHSYGSYAFAQLRRLQNALARDNYPQAEKEEHIFNSIQGQSEHLHTNYAFFNDNDVKLYIDKSNKADFEKEIFIDINLQHYPLRDLKSMYSDMANVIKDYDSLNHRNSKKDELHLNKHSQHLVRLLLMGIEILEGKGIHTHRKNDLDLLMKLRNGDLVTEVDGVKDYSEVFSIVNDLQKRFDYAKNNTNLPKEPDYKAIEELVMEINRGVLDINE